MSTVTTPTLTTLTNFSSIEGSPNALYIDAAGDLLGTTPGTDAYGAEAAQVFEIADNGGTYASTPTTLTNFPNLSDNLGPNSGLTTDAAGDLFGTSQLGYGQVFEIAKTASGYASTPTTLVSFNDTNGSNPQGGLITDSTGDLFGTTSYGGKYDDGTVYEIPNTPTGYASTPTVLVNFNGTDGQYPMAGLVADAAGDLFGTTTPQSGLFNGTIFEIAKTATGYASMATTLGNVENPLGGLVMDEAGDLFGTASEGGLGLIGDGSVFELAKTASGYSTPTILASFNGTDGASPQAGLLIDADGDLFGTTAGGGANGSGTVFEITKTATGYASTPTTVISFTQTDGADPVIGLVANAAGDIFGTTSKDGATQSDNNGTVFEITSSGYQTVAGASGSTTTSGGSGSSTTSGGGSSTISTVSLDGLVGLTGPAEDITGVSVQSATTAGTLGTSTYSLATLSGVATGAPALGFSYGIGETFKIISVNDAASSINVNYYLSGSAYYNETLYVVGYSANALLLSSTTPSSTATESVSTTAETEVLSILSTSQLASGTAVSFTGSGTVPTAFATGSLGTTSTSGGSGSSTVTSGSGSSTMSGGSGSTTMSGGSGSSTMSGGSGSSTISGASGSTNTSGGSGNSTVVSGGATPTVEAGSAGGAFTVPAGASEYVTSEGNNTIYATTGAPTISASAGNPVVFANNASLDFIGGSGAATVIGGSADNTVQGGSGSLVLFATSPTTFTPGTGASTIIGGTGALTATLGAGGGQVFGATGGGNTLAVAAGSTGNAALVGVGNGDVLTDAGAGSDILVAGAGAETLNAVGSTGTLDAFFGGSGADYMQGGSGQNFFLAGTGNETLTGGGGLSAFDFLVGSSARTETITNFNSGDLIGLFGYGGNQPVNAYAASVYASASVTSSGTTLTLADNTTVILQDFTNLSQANLLSA